MKKLLFVLLLAASVAQAETYKWTDREGTVHFSESRAEIPALYRKSATPLGIDLNGSGDDATAATSPTSPTSRRSTVDSDSVAPGVEEVKGRLQHDKESMALIRELQNDPQMQTLLNDPAVLRAVQNGDYSALMNNPAFMKLLGNPKVQQIEKRMRQGETK